MERSAVVESVHPPWFSPASEAPGEASTLTFVSDQAEKLAEISIDCCEIHFHLNYMECSIYFLDQTNDTFFVWHCQICQTLDAQHSVGMVDPWGHPCPAINIGTGEQPVSNTLNNYEVSLSERSKGCANCKNCKFQCDKKHQILQLKEQASILGSVKESENLIKKRERGRARDVASFDPSSLLDHWSLLDARWPISSLWPRLCREVSAYNG